jgi:hypothetical protein
MRKVKKMRALRIKPVSDAQKVCILTYDARNLYPDSFVERHKSNAWGYIGPYMGIYRRDLRIRIYAYIRALAELRRRQRRVYAYTSHIRKPYLATLLITLFLFLLLS